MSWADAVVLIVAAVFAFGVLGLLIVADWKVRSARKLPPVRWHAPAGCDGNCATCKRATCPHGSR